MPVVFPATRIIHSYALDDEMKATRGLDFLTYRDPVTGSTKKFKTIMEDAQHLRLIVQINSIQRIDTIENFTRMLEQRGPDQLRCLVVLDELDSLASSFQEVDAAGNVFMKRPSEQINCLRRLAVGGAVIAASADAYSTDQGEALLNAIAPGKGSAVLMSDTPAIVVDFKYTFRRPLGCPHPENPSVRMPGPGEEIYRTLMLHRLRRARLKYDLARGGYWDRLLQLVATKKFGFELREWLRFIGAWNDADCLFIHSGSGQLDKKRLVDAERGLVDIVLLIVTPVMGPGITLTTRVGLILVATSSAQNCALKRDLFQSCGRPWRAEAYMPDPEGDSGGKCEVVMLIDGSPSHKERYFSSGYGNCLFPLEVKRYLHTTAMKQLGRICGNAQNAEKCYERRDSLVHSQDAILWMQACNTAERELCRHHPIAAVFYFASLPSRRYCISRLKAAYVESFAAGSWGEGALPPLQITCVLPDVDTARSGAREADAVVESFATDTRKQYRWFLEVFRAWFVERVGPDVFRRDFFEYPERLAIHWGLRPESPACTLLREIRNRLAWVECFPARSATECERIAAVRAKLEAEAPAAARTVAEKEQYEAKIKVLADKSKTPCPLELLGTKAVPVDRLVRMRVFSRQELVAMPAPIESGTQVQEINCLVELETLFGLVWISLHRVIGGTLGGGFSEAECKDACLGPPGEQGGAAEAAIVAFGETSRVVYNAPPDPLPRGADVSGWHLIAAMHEELRLRAKLRSMFTPEELNEIDFGPARNAMNERAETFRQQLDLVGRLVLGADPTRSRTDLFGAIGRVLEKSVGITLRTSRLCRTGPDGERRKMVGEVQLIQVGRNLLPRWRLAASPGECDQRPHIAAHAGSSPAARAARGASSTSDGGASSTSGGGASDGGASDGGVARVTVNVNVERIDRWLLCLSSESTSPTPAGTQLRETLKRISEALDGGRLLQVTTAATEPGEPRRPQESQMSIFYVDPTARSVLLAPSSDNEKNRCHHFTATLDDEAVPGTLILNTIRDAFGSDRDTPSLDKLLATARGKADLSAWTTKSSKRDVSPTETLRSISQRLCSSYYSSSNGSADLKALLEELPPSSNIRSEVNHRFEALLAHMRSGTDPALPSGAVVETDISHDVTRVRLLLDARRITRGYHVLDILGRKLTITPDTHAPISSSQFVEPIAPSGPEDENDYVDYEGDHKDVWSFSL